MHDLVIVAETPRASNKRRTGLLTEFLQTRCRRGQIARDDCLPGLALLLPLCDNGLIGSKRQGVVGASVAE